MFHTIALTWSLGWLIPWTPDLLGNITSVVEVDLASRVHSYKMGSGEVETVVGLEEASTVNLDQERQRSLNGII